LNAYGENLVPVTLELGGKSPAIIEPGFSLPRAAQSIAYGKLSNAGQTCVAPDYALVHESEVDGFVTAYKDAVRSSYPGGASDRAYAAIISQRHYERLARLIADADAKGAQIIEIGERAGAQGVRTMLPTVIVGATLDMTIMQQEIFGPILPIVSYKGPGGRHCICERSFPPARALHLQRSPKHHRTRPVAHDQRRCDCRRSAG
jgi:coniferyl-aldehyde dehydrogenase